MEISDIIQKSAAGEGLSKPDAKKAAWLHLISKMHVEGTLKDLFPDPRISSKEAGHEHDVDQFAMEPADVDEQTLEAEKYELPATALQINEAFVSIALAHGFTAPVLAS